MGQFPFSSNNSKQELKFEFMHFCAGIFPTFYFLLMTLEQYFSNHVDSTSTKYVAKIICFRIKYSQKTLLIEHPHH